MKVTFAIDLPDSDTIAYAWIMAAKIQKWRQRKVDVEVSFADGRERLLDKKGGWIEVTPEPAPQVQEEQKPEPAKPSRFRTYGNERRCAICEKWKPLGEYLTNGIKGRDYGGGNSYYCKSCYAVYLLEFNRRRNEKISTKGLIAYVRQNLDKLLKEIAP